MPSEFSPPETQTVKKGNQDYKATQTEMYLEEFTFVVSFSCFVF